MERLIMHNGEKLIYLASPHSDPDYMVMQHRYEKARDAVAILQRNNIMVFSPICHSHPPQMVNKDVVIHFESYRKFDEKLISVSDELWILMIDGWNKSFGIMNEVRLAERLNLPIKCLFLNYELADFVDLRPFSLYEKELRKE
jgi:hypothetical protein